MSYNNFNQKSYQPSYVNTAYSNNTNNNSFRTSYNVITNPINYISNKNILNLAAKSNKSLSYGTNFNPISYN